jgi:hypothetical protein
MKKLLAGLILLLLTLPALAQSNVNSGQYLATPPTLVDTQRTPLMTDVNGRVMLSGTVASGSTNAGNPTKIGCVYNATEPTVSDGQVADAQCTLRGELRMMALGNVVTGADDVANTTNITSYGATGSSATSTIRPLAVAPWVLDTSGTWDRLRDFVRVEDVASATGDSGVPSLAQRNDTNYASTSAELDYGVPAMTNANQLIVRPYGAPGGDWKSAAGASGIVNTTTAVTIKTAGGAGAKNYVRSCQIQTATLGAATELALRDGAAGTVIWRTQLQTTALPLTQVTFDPPLAGTANTLMEVVTLTAVTGGVYVNCSGLVAP